MTSLGIQTFEELSEWLGRCADEIHQLCSEATRFLSQGTDLDPETAERVKREQMLNTIPRRTSAATFRELLILNEIYRRRSRSLNFKESKSGILGTSRFVRFTV